MILIALKLRLSCTVIHDWRKLLDGKIEHEKNETFKEPSKMSMNLDDASGSKQMREAN